MDHIVDLVELGRNPGGPRPASGSGGVSFPFFRSSAVLF